MSPDKEFQELGHKSGIDYGKSFIGYKGFLSDNTPEMKGIISFYNQELFGHQSKKPVRSATTQSAAIDDALDQLRRGLYGKTADSVAEGLSAQLQDKNTPAPASPTQSERHVSISVTSSISHSVTASSRISNTTNNPSTAEHDAEKPSPPSRPKPKPVTKKKAPIKTTSASEGDADDAPPTPAKKRNSNKRGKAPPVAAPSERSLRERK